MLNTFLTGLKHCCIVDLRPALVCDISRHTQYLVPQHALQFPLLKGTVVTLGLAKGIASCREGSGIGPTWMFWVQAAARDLQSSEVLGH